ncbi:molybdopterin-dependent oxidoreductase [Mycobacterium arosiense]|uniref:molybdopterin-dependent oxidoreductase n=1 Tax=Mycobacterium arosiense TaxID=425468 RepID=UPI00114E1EB5|nr:molybdopterin-dependent oxidoreductase [Mycobacterium arosiense]
MKSDTREVTTYCRICEPQCGLIATVTDGRLVRVRGDHDHPHSQGFSCVKSQAAVDVAYDPDRVLHPLKRIGEPGNFQRVSWNDALDDIAIRLRHIQREHGKDALGLFVGNPPAFGYSAALGLAGFRSAMGIRWRYGVNAEDASSRMAANALLYGSVAIAPKPDLWRTRFALVIGANPLISHGSMVTEARFKDALDSIIDRGGRVLVVDPRRSETARRYEHVAIRAGTDPYFLLRSPKCRAG